MIFNVNVIIRAVSSFISVTLRWNTVLCDEDTELKCSVTYHYKMKSACDKDWAGYKDRKIEIDKIVK